MDTIISTVFEPLPSKDHALLANLVLETAWRKQGDRHGPKDLAARPWVLLTSRLLRVICASGYKGPIGILGHTQDDAEEAPCAINLDGLDWLVRQACRSAARPRGRHRVRPSHRRQPSPPSQPAGLSNRPRFAWGAGTPRSLFNANDNAALVAGLLERGQKKNQATLRTAPELFASPKLACLSCHQAGGQGGRRRP